MTARTHCEDDVDALDAVLSPLLLGGVITSRRLADAVLSAGYHAKGNCAPAPVPVESTPPPPPPPRVTAAGGFVVYSPRGRAWWRPDRAGLTRRLADAGRFDRVTARALAAGERYPQTMEGLTGAVLLGAGLIDAARPTTVSGAIL